MSNPDPFTPRAGTSGPRPSAKTERPVSVGGSLATVAILFGVLLAIAAPPALLAGLLVGVAVGGAAVAVSRRRAASDSLTFCVPKAGVCVQF